MPDQNYKKNQIGLRPAAWAKFDDFQKTIRPVAGGYSNAQRGLVTLHDGGVAFIKIGTDDGTKGWISREIKAYGFLKENAYSYIPEFLSANEDETGFALEALLPENGWDWSETWNNERLRATLAAVDALAAKKPDAKYSSLVKPVLAGSNDGWARLVDSRELQSTLVARLKGITHTLPINNLEAHAEKSSHYDFSHDFLVHNDIRADNCPWNASNGQVKLVDWDWFGLGDRKIDLAAMLVHVQNSGFNILPDFADRLDADALHWIAGFWLASGSRPVLPGGSEKLRHAQLRAGITAFKLANELGHYL